MTGTSQLVVGWFSFFNYILNNIVGQIVINIVTKSWATSRYAFTTELRDTGHYGFELPKEQIIPSGEVTANLT